MAKVAFNAIEKYTQAVRYYIAVNYTQDLQCTTQFLNMLEGVLLYYNDRLLSTCSHVNWLMNCSLFSTSSVQNYAGCIADVRPIHFFFLGT